VTDATGLQFESLTRTTLSSQVADAISIRIDKGEIAVGAQLPSERSLGESFGVSRVSIREAIQLLMAKGYVEILPGKGTFVIDHEVRKAASLQSWVGGREEELLMMVELRLIVEPGIAALAAEKATPEAVTVLLETARMLSECPRTEISEVDAEFHRQIATMTGNALICELLAASLKSTEPLRERTLQDRDRRLLAARGHVAIAEAIAAGDPTSAHAAMISHLKDAQASL
jgi:GntR family transcriptional repressor for pyruvate dehydrogenase complex